MADAMVRERQQKIAAVMQQQQAHEQQQAKAYEAQLAEARARQDADFNQRAARLVPNWEQQRGRVQEAALQTLQAAGLSRQDITNLWSGTGHLVDMHSAAAQELLLKAALYIRHKPKPSRFVKLLCPRWFALARIALVMMVRQAWQNYRRV